VRALSRVWVCRRAVRIPSLAARRQLVLRFESRTVCHFDAESVQDHRNNARTTLGCATQRSACATFALTARSGVDLRNSHLDPDPESRSPQTKRPRFQQAPAPPPLQRGRSVGWRAAWGLAAAASRGNPSLRHAAESSGTSQLTSLERRTVSAQNRGWRSASRLVGDVQSYARRAARGLTSAAARTELGVLLVRRFSALFSPHHSLLVAALCL
jgi:hypothetical protein